MRGDLFWATAPTLATGMRRRVTMPLTEALRTLVAEPTKGALGDRRATLAPDASTT